MLKFLTHKLRTHSINDDHHTGNAEEDRDSGTESDEEVDGSAMSERMCSVSPTDTGCSMDTPPPDQHDPHSSEEELEVINANLTNDHRLTNDEHEDDGKQSSPSHQPPPPPPSQRPLRATSVSLPEKRKWSQIHNEPRYTPENEENMSHYGNLSPRSSYSPYHKCYATAAIAASAGAGGNVHHVEHSGSSDEEVHHLLASMATPVQFRTSPPLEAVKPGRKTVIGGGGGVSLSPPPPKLIHYEVSPRKKSRHARHSHVQQRPYLDFEKMQQVKARSVTTWRHTGEHGGELSVYCW